MLTKLKSLMSCTSNSIVNSISHEKSVGIPCSGRGDCLNGTCFCEIRYSGDECDNYNISYHASNLKSNHELLEHFNLIYIYTIYCRCFIGILLCGSFVPDSVAHML